MTVSASTTETSAAAPSGEHREDCRVLVSASKLRPLPERSGWCWLPIIDFEAVASYVGDEQEVNIGSILIGRRIRFTVEQRLCVGRQTYEFDVLIVPVDAPGFGGRHGMYGHMDDIRHSRIEETPERLANLAIVRDFAERSDGSLLSAAEVTETLDHTRPERGGRLGCAD
jgi:hypothetical protein